MDGSVSLIV